MTGKLKSNPNVNGVWASQLPARNECGSALTSHAFHMSVEVDNSYSYRLLSLSRLGSHRSSHLCLTHSLVYTKFTDSLRNVATLARSGRKHYNAHNNNNVQ